MQYLILMGAYFALMCALFYHYWCKINDLNEED